MSTTLGTRLSPAITKIGDKLGFDAHYFARSTGFVFLAHCINILRGIVTGYLIARMFPKEMYGEYRFVVSILGVVGVIGLSGLQPAISRAVAQQKAEDVPLRFTMKVFSLICLLGPIVILGCIPFVAPKRETLWPMFAVAALLFLPNNVGPMYFGSVAIGQGKFNRTFWANLWSNTLVTASVLVMLLVQPSATLLLALVTGIPALVYLAMSVRLIKEFPSKEKRWDILVYGLKVTLADVPMALSWYVDGLLISAFFGMNQLATFAVAIMIPEQVKVLCKDVLPIAFSKQAASKDTWEFRKRLAKVVGIATIIFVLGIAAYAAISPWLMPLVFPRYSAAEIVPLTIAAAVASITFPASLFPQHLEAHGMAREMLISQWLASAIFVICLVVFIPKYGPIGAIVSRFIFRLIYVGYAGLVLWFKPPREVVA